MKHQDRFSTQKNPFKIFGYTDRVTDFHQELIDDIVEGIQAGDIYDRASCDRYVGELFYTYLQNTSDQWQIVQAMNKTDFGVHRSLDALAESAWNDVYEEIHVDNLIQDFGDGGEYNDLIY